MPYDLSIPDVLSHKSIRPEKRIHDAEKPIELIKDIMRFCTKKNDVVLDPFAGSMSTAHAGLSLGRHTVSIEVDSNVIDKAIKERNKDMTLNCF
jgi:DNA modification methylase